MLEYSGGGPTLKLCFGDNGLVGLALGMGSAALIRGRSMALVTLPVKRGWVRVVEAVGWRDFFAVVLSLVGFFVVLLLFSLPRTADRGRPTLAGLKSFLGPISTAIIFLRGEDLDIDLGFDLGFRSPASLRGGVAIEAAVVWKKSTLAFLSGEGGTMTLISPWLDNT